MSVVNSEYESWNRIDNHLKSWVYSSVSDSMMIHIIGKNKTFFDMWVSLEKYYALTLKGGVMEIKIQLQSLKKGGMSITYFVFVKGLSDQLMAVGEPDSDKDVIVYICRGVGLDLNPYVASININSNVN